MTVYVDDAAIPYKGKPRFHLMASSVHELHDFAKTVGIHRCWFHASTRHPHYDITDPQRTCALSAGATAVSSRDIAGLARSHPQVDMFTS